MNKDFKLSFNSQSCFCYNQLVDLKSQEFYFIFLLKDCENIRSLKFFYNGM
jgi:hypothetical protein